MTKNNEDIIIENKFTKEQIINSKIYADKKDVLNAILEDKEYTKKQVDEVIKKFMKGKVI